MQNRPRIEELWGELNCSGKVVLVEQDGVLKLRKKTYPIFSMFWSIGIMGGVLYIVFLSGASSLIFILASILAFAMALLL